MSQVKNTSRRFVRNALLALFAVVFVVLAVWMANGDLDGNDKLASIAGLFVALAALVVAVIGLIRIDEPPTLSASDLADDLAKTVGKEWYEEARVRRLRDPKVLPLTWSTGRMDGKFDDVTRQLADGYGQVRSGRLVVLGEPGSGKTVLAILLTLGLLNCRSAGSAVPVLLAASSWDPIQESMDDWVIRTVATSYYNGQQDSPRALLDHGLLLPILDGLDEIPESARRSAVRGINDAIGADRPVVVTCRSAEYDDVIEGGAPVLRQAPVVRVMPVAVADVIAYLKAVPSWPNGTSWDAVFDDLGQRPDSPLAAALSTPLMVSLVRTIYQRCGGDPAELLDAKKFGSRHMVEDYLVDRVIDAAYAPDPLPSGELVTAPASGWNATQARRWLTFLARYLHQHRERDLAWWRLSDRLVSPWMAPGIGLGFGVALMIAASALMSSDGNLYSREALSRFFPGGTFGVGAVVAVLGTVLWYGGVGRAPGRMAFVVRGSLGRLRRGFATGVALVSILVVPVLLGVAATLFIGGRGDDNHFSDIRYLAKGLMVGVALACVVGFAVAAHNWLNALPERSAQASPFSFIQHDRRSSLVGALAAGVVVGLTMWPAFTVAVLMGEIFGQGIAGGLGKAGTTSFSGDPIMLGVPLIQMIGILVLPGVVVVLLVLLTRAWPRFVLARALLAARGHLPWRLLTFLVDARDRELLRQAGGMYQFRHIRLQERLAASPGVATTGTRRPAPTPTTAGRRRRIMAMVGAVVIASTAVITLSTFNYLRCDSLSSLGADVDRVRSFTSSGSLCIGIVPESQWNELVLNRAAFEELRVGNESAKGNGEVTIAVLGALRTTNPGARGVISRQLDGVVLAQRESKRLGQPVRVLLVDSGSAYIGSGVATAALERAASLGSRPGVNLPAMVTLGGGVNIGIPVFGAGVHYDGADRLLSPLFETWAEFDQQLRSSLMRRFAQYTLKTEATLTSSDLTVNRLYLEGGCASAEQLVLAYDEPDKRRVGLFLGMVKDKYCGKGHVRLVTTDSSVAEYLHLPVQGFPDLTVYYPVVEEKPTARRCEEVAAELFHSPAGSCVSADMATEFSYQATLNAAGKGNFVVHEMSADQNRWITTPFQR
jgi:hypothetical protein